MPPTVQAAVLGVVQGATEFLPVSSSAHLIIARAFFGFDADKFGLAFDVACHVGTLIAALIYFRDDVIRMIEALPELFAPARSDYARLIWLLAVGTIPAIIVGLLFNKYIEEHMRTPQIAAACLAIGGLLFFPAERLVAHDRSDRSLTYLEAFWIGCAQALALVPGVSRSGITITAGLALGLRREEAVRFSFLMLMPITLGAGLLKSKYLLANMHDASVWVALLTSFAFGIAAIHILISYVRSKSFAPFVIYRLALAAFIGAWLWLH